MTAGEQYCFDLVRATDKDRYLASLFAPDGKRPHLLALYAFNIEIGRVRDSVSEPRLGEIRHQWWCDALDAIYAGNAPDHPVAQELARAVEAGGVPKAPLINMIAARQFDLYDDPMPSLGDLEGYLGETSSALIQMAALVLAGEDASMCAEVAGFAGVAYGLAGLLRSLPLHRTRGQCYVPGDVLKRHGASPAELLAGRQTPGVEAALAGLCSTGGERLVEARDKRHRIPAAALPAFLHAGLTDLYLRRFGKLGAGAMTTVADVPQWRRQIRLYRLAWAGEF